MITVSVDVSRAVARLKRLEQNLIKEGNFTLKKLVNVGKAFATAIAPRDTGATVHGIVTRKGKQTEWQIVALNMHPHKWKGGDFNLPYYMHYSGKKIWHGDEQFMFTTRDYLEGLAGPEARNMVARVTKK